MKYRYRLLFTAVVIISIAGLFSQCSSRHNATHKPKLVVGIVVDQMRWDFLYRYSDKYSANGFKRLLNGGYSCANTHINYIPSYTGPGHSCIYTGSVPAIHGIAGNNWYDRDRNTSLYCVEDSTESRTGDGVLKGNISPRNLLVTTITDELRLATNFKSKVIALALKDRSSVLPGGHTSNAAYFFDGKAGNFVTSTYYMKKLPDWVTTFNDKKLPAKYLSANWSTLLPIEKYVESTADDNLFERKFKGEDHPAFVHNISEIAKKSPEIIAATPFGNSLTLDFAKAAIEGEKLGSGKATDFLAISLSSTDYIGHQFGPNSVEVEDCYLRLDKDIASFLAYLDEKVGKDNYLVFLTADHGAAHVPGFLEQDDIRIPSGRFDADTTIKLLNAALKEKFDGEKPWISSGLNMQIYLDRDQLNKGEQDKKATRKEVFTFVKGFLMKFDGVANVVDLEDVSSSSLQGNLKTLVSNGYNPKRSGDFQIIYNPGWIEDEPGIATTHGTAYPYDTHIPLIWYGWKVKHGEDHADVHMTDIAPTLAAMLHIQEPNGCVGKVINGVQGK